MISTLRRSLLTIFCAYIGFILAGWAFQKMTEYDDFVDAARTHSIVGSYLISREEKIVPTRKRDAKE